MDLLITLHGTCDTRECAAQQALVNGVQGEMVGGSYTYLTLPGMNNSRSPARKQNLDILVKDQVKAGTVKESDIDAAVEAILRTKFALGLFESMFVLFPQLSLN